MAAVWCLGVLIPSLEWRDLSGSMPRDAGGSVTSGKLLPQLPINLDHQSLLSCEPLALFPAAVSPQPQFRPKQEEDTTPNKLR